MMFAYSPGAVVAGYRIGRLLGAGSFGAVYEAEAGPGADVRGVVAAGTRVALKELFDPAALELVRGEFAVLSRLRHPQLPRYHELFAAGGRGYLVMALVPGGSLLDLLAAQ